MQNQVIQAANFLRHCSEEELKSKLRQKSTGKVGFCKGGNDYAIILNSFKSNTKLSFERYNAIYFPTAQKLASYF